MTVLRVDHPTAHQVFDHEQVDGIEITSACGDIVISNCDLRYIVITGSGRKHSVSILNTRISNYGTGYGFQSGHGFYAAAVDRLWIDRVDITRDQRFASDNEHEHGVYIQGGANGGCLDVTVTNTYIANAPGEGLKMRSGGKARHVWLDRCPIGLYAGGGDPNVGEAQPGGVDIDIRDTVITRTLEPRRWGLTFGNIHYANVLNTIVADASLATALQSNPAYPPMPTIHGRGNILNGTQQVDVPGRSVVLRPMNGYTGPKTEAGVRAWLLS